MTTPGGGGYGKPGKRDRDAVLAGNAYRDTTPTIPLTWAEALTAFEQSAFAREYLGERFATLYARTRRGEMQDFASYVTPLEYSWYLTTS